MRGKLWLSSFITAVELKRKEYPVDKWAKLAKTASGQEGKWTQFMGAVMDEIGKRLKCEVIRKKPGDKESGEYFNIDAVFVEEVEYPPNWKSGEYDPFVLPVAVAELENQYDPDKISYCLWKLLCVRAPVRALICYQENIEKVRSLRERLERVIWEGSLMKGSDGDLLVIVGNDSVKEWKTRGYFRSFFSAYEWRRDSLEKVD